MLYYDLSKKTQPSMTSFFFWIPKHFFQSEKLITMYLCTSTSLKNNSMKKCLFFFVNTWKKCFLKHLCLMKISFGLIFLIKNFAASSAKEPWLYTLISFFLFYTWGHAETWWFLNRNSNVFSWSFVEIVIVH